MWREALMKKHRPGTGNKSDHEIGRSGQEKEGEETTTTQTPGKKKKQWRGNLPEGPEKRGKGKVAKRQTRTARRKTKVTPQVSNPPGGRYTAAQKTQKGTTRAYGISSEV